MYHYANGTWSELDSCSVNTTTNTITCTAPHFSIFAIFGNPVSSSASSSGGVSRSGGNIQSRVANLIALGNFTDAERLKREWHWLFPQAQASIVSVVSVRNLFTGLSGEDVRALQNLLISQGYSIPAGATGFFGSQTRSALSAYQRTNNISPAVGYFGPLTRATMKATELTGLWW